MNILIAISRCCVGCLLCLSLLSCGQLREKKNEQPVRPAMTSIYTGQPVTVDGLAAAGEWSAADSIVVYDDSLRIPNQIIIRSQWDSSYLYFLFDARDSNLQAIQTVRDHPQLAKDDIIEFLLDANDDHGTCWNSDDIIYHINLFGQTKDDRGNDSCRSDARWNGLAAIAARVYGTVNVPGDIDTGYVVEVAIPWLEIGRVPMPGLVIGANFGGQSDGVFYDWVDAWPFRQPFKFGTLTLTKKDHASHQ